MRTLIVGTSGQLATELYRQSSAGGVELALPRKVEIADDRAINALLEERRPQLVINAAAYTAVDRAEQDRSRAFAVNADGPRHLARWCAANDAALIHVSTDYVFDGRPPLLPDGAPRAYLERDPTGPATVYGLTKLEGEELVMRASPRHGVARTAWLFGLGGRNFAETMLTLAQSRDSVRVVADQIGCPTWTGHLAPALLGLLEREVGGIVHLAGTGAVSWHGFAAEIFRQAELECEVQEAGSAEMARPAPRPAWSALESERDEVLPLPPWQDGLAGYLAARAGMMRG